MCDKLKSVVIDNGSGFIKAGFADDCEPISVFSSIVGEPKHSQFNSKAPLGYLVGDEAQSKRGILKLEYPMKNGLIEDWDNMQKIWDYTFSEKLQIKPEEHSILMTDSWSNPRSYRAKLAQIMFEGFNIPALYIANQLSLSLFGSGRTTGIVLNCGDGVCHVVPLSEGRAVSNAFRLDVGGRGLTDYLMKLLNINGYVIKFNSSCKFLNQTVVLKFISNSF